MSNQNCDQLNDQQENQLHNFINELYKCYEENGFLRYLSTQVRNQMFSMLQNLQDDSPESSSLFKLPILGLLVAEFLLHNKCFSTLLAFKSEKPNLKNIQNFIENVGELAEKMGLDPIGNIRLKQADVSRLLENMGIRRETSNTICTLYYGSNQESLLSCILQVLINGKQKKNTNQDHQMGITEEPSTSSQDESSIKEYYLPSFCSKCFSNEKAEEKGIKFNDERKKIEKELREKEKQLAELAVNLKEQHDVISQRLEHVEDTAQMLRHQEKEIKEMKAKESIRIQEKSSELNLRQRQLDLEFKRLKEERASMAQVRQELDETRLQLEIASKSLVHSRTEISFLKDLQRQCVYLREELDATKRKLETQTIDKEQETLEENLLQTIVRQLRQENADLRNQTQLQKMRIEELDENTYRLNQRLNEALIFRGTITAPTLNAPPAPPPPLTLRPPSQAPQSPNQVRQLGSGEELSFNPSHRNLNSTRHRFFHSREMRRKPPQRLLIQTSNSSDESSSLTDDILVEARMRLRKLEEESAAVDRSYRNFRLRQATTSSSNAYNNGASNVYDFSQHHSNLGFHFQIRPSEHVPYPFAHSNERTWIPVNPRSFLTEQIKNKNLGTLKPSISSQIKDKIINIPNPSYHLPYPETINITISSSDDPNMINNSKLPTTFESLSSENSRLVIYDEKKKNENEVVVNKTKEKKDDQIEVEKNELKNNKNETDLNQTKEHLENNSAMNNKKQTVIEPFIEIKNKTIIPLPEPETPSTSSKENEIISSLVFQTQEATEPKIIQTTTEKESNESEKKEEISQNKEVNEEESKNKAPETNPIQLSNVQQPIIPSLFNLSSSSEEALSGGLKNKSTEDDDSW